MPRNVNAYGQQPIHSIKRQVSSSGYRLVYVDGGAGVDQEFDPVSHAEWGDSPATAFATIQYAMDHIANFEGDVYVLVAAGTYTEEVSITARMTGRVFLVGQPGTEVANGVLTSCDDGANEPSGMHRLIGNVGDFGACALGQTIAVEVADPMAGPSRWEMLTILEIAPDASYVVVAGDGGPPTGGSCYPAINGNVAGAAQYAGATWRCYESGTVIEAPDVAGATCVYINGQAQTDELLTNEMIPVSVGLLWIKMSVANVTTPGTNRCLVADNGAYVAVDCCQVQGSGANPTACINVADRSTLLSGSYFNGSFDGNGGQLLHMQSIPTEVETFTSAPGGGGHPTIYADLANGCNFTNRKGFGDVSKGALAGYTLVANDRSHLVLEGCFLGASPFTNQSAIVDDADWISALGNLAESGIQSVGCNGQYLGRGKFSFVILGEACNVSVSGDLHIRQVNAVGGLVAVLQVQDQSLLTIKGTLTIDALHDDDGILVDRESELTVIGNAAISNVPITTGRRAIQVEGQSKALFLSPVTINSDVSNGPTTSVIYVENQSSLSILSSLTTTITGASSTSFVAAVNESNVYIDNFALTSSAPTGGGAGMINLLAQSRMRVFGQSTFTFTAATATGRLIQLENQCELYTGTFEIIPPGGAEQAWANSENKILVENQSKFIGQPLADSAAEGLDYGGSGFVNIKDQSTWGTAYSFAAPVKIEDESKMLSSGLTIGSAAGSRVGYDSPALTVDGNSEVYVDGGATLFRDVDATTPLLDVRKGSRVRSENGITADDTGVNTTSSIASIVKGSRLECDSTGDFDTTATGPSSIAFYVDHQSSVWFASDFNLSVQGAKCALMMVTSMSELHVDGDMILTSAALEQSFWHSVSISYLSKLRVLGVFTLTGADMLDGALAVTQQSRMDVYGNVLLDCASSVGSASSFVWVDDHSTLQQPNAGGTFTTTCSSDDGVTRPFWVNDESDVNIGDLIMQTGCGIVVDGISHMVVDSAQIGSAGLEMTNDLRAIHVSDQGAFQCKGDLTIRRNVPPNTKEMILVQRQSRFECFGNAALNDTHMSSTSLIDVEVQSEILFNENVTVNGDAEIDASASMLYVHEQRRCYVGQTLDTVGQYGGAGNPLGWFIEIADESQGFFQEVLHNGGATFPGVTTPILVNYLSRIEVLADSSSVVISTAGVPCFELRRGSSARLPNWALNTGFANLDVGGANDFKCGGNANADWALGTGNYDDVGGAAGTREMCHIHTL